MTKEDLFWAELSKDDYDADLVLQLAHELGLTAQDLAALAAQCVQRAAEIYAGAAAALEHPRNVTVH